jgi:hypothetical protein
MIPRSAPPPPLAHCLGLVLCWSLDEGHRVGECALLTAPSLLGRGGPTVTGDLPRLDFLRMRPGINERTPALTSPRLSRTQLRLEPEGDDRAVVQNVGRCPLRINGQAADGGTVHAGDVLTFESALVLYVERRPTLLPRLEHYLDDGAIRFGRADLDGIVGESPAAWALREEIALAAASDRHVLVVGQDPNERNLVGRALHRLSPRAEGPLVALEVDSRSEGTLGGALFGSSTNLPSLGAGGRAGAVDDANGGALLLDDLAALPASHQARLMDALGHGGRYVRPGESQPRDSDFRLYAATSPDARPRVHPSASSIAPDLTIPRLHQRRADIPLLLASLLRNARRDTTPRVAAYFAREGRLQIPRPSPRLVEALLAHEFARDQQELEDAIWTSFETSPGEFLALTEAVRRRLDHPPRL